MYLVLYLLNILFSKRIFSSIENQSENDLADFYSNIELQKERF